MRRVSERLPDEQRQLIVVLVTKAMFEIKDDPEMKAQERECLEIIKRLSGTDTVVTVERAYPSGAQS